MTARTAATIGALLAGTGVALGAFGAHALKTRLSVRDMEVFEVAMRYQMYHAMALFIAAALLSRGISQAAPAAWAFIVGTVVFCGSLHLMIFTGARWLGAVTPVGGAAFIAGWGLLALATRRL